jgi:glycosyltransferase involved in cell wall biosynthesis
MVLSNRESVMAECPASHRTSQSVTVGVIIPTFNHGRFIADAISSVLGQTRAADEIIVVDDGSTDNSPSVVGCFPNVILIRQENRGRSTARNTGLQTCTSNYVLFLDADDRLLPNALEWGVRCAAENPDCGFIYGAHYDLSEGEHVRRTHHYCPISGDPHLALLRRNLIRMQATVLFRRDCLIEAGGYDESLERAEDYDLYLRIARNHSVACHPQVVAEYRWHGLNTCGDPMKMLQATLDVLNRQEHCADLDASGREALHDGRRIWRDYYAQTMIEMAYKAWPSRRSLRLLSQAAETSPLTLLLTLKSYVRRRIRRVMPPPMARWIRQRFGPTERLPFRSVRFGDLRRLSPISPNFGFDRGTPIDRYYIERFLAQNSGDIRGRVLEAGDNAYTMRFGGNNVTVSDVLDLEATNPCATIVGDLTRPDLLPESTFDSIVLTHALQYAFDMRAAIASLYRALKPGGTLLLTVPGVSGVDDGERGSTVAWSLTGPAARRLFEEQFRVVNVETHGNVFAAIAFLHGLALEEVSQAELDMHDPRYPVVVAIRAVKALTQ